MGEMFLFLAVTLLLVTLAVTIPMDLGQKTGLWVIKKRFPTWPVVKTSRSSFLGMGALIVAGVWAVELMIMLIVALGIPNINLQQQRIWQPFYIYEALQARQLQEPGYVALHIILMVITFFICGFAATFFTRWYHFLRKNRTEDP